VVLREFTPDAQRDAVRRLLELASDPATRERCVGAAHRLFSLDDGVAAYDRLYRSLVAA
jgi:hypothetical protein